MHCIDHIREDLMCNADISLRGSADYVSFGTTAPRGKQCRDLDAMGRWANERNWDGYWEYLNDVLHLDPVKAEKDSVRQKNALEEELGREIPYDQLKIEYDPETEVLEVSVA